MEKKVVLQQCQTISLFGYLGLGGCIGLDIGKFPLRENWQAASFSLSFLWSTCWEGYQVGPVESWKPLSF